MPGKFFKSVVPTGVGEFIAQCFTRVNGLFLSVEAAADANGCAEACKTVEDCQWFTYNSEDRSCVLTTDREFVSDCTTCTYGHNGCIPEGRTFSTVTGS